MWPKVTPSTNEKCVSSGLRGHMKRISGSRAVCTAFRYSVIGLVWRWWLAAKVLHCITKKIFISALSRAHCCNQSCSGMREKLQRREIRGLGILCETMDYFFEGVRSRKGSLLGGTKECHTRFCCKKHLLVQLESVFLCVASVFNLSKALLRE